MNVEIQGNTININSPVVTLNDAEKLLQILASKENESKLVLNVNSFSFPSSVIGELLRLSDNGTSIVINVHDETLYELFKALNLTSKFKIRKI